MISIQLPDGSQREFPGPVTVAEVAASIGAGLAWRCCGDMGIQKLGRKKTRTSRAFSDSNDEKDPD